MESLECLASVPSILPTVVKNQKKTHKTMIYLSIHDMLLNEKDISK